jgi:hypothetical protein
MIAAPAPSGRVVSARNPVNLIRFFGRSKLWYVVNNPCAHAAFSPTLVSAGELQTSVLLKPGDLGPAPDAECLTSGVDAETVGADCAPIDGDGKTIGGNVLIPDGEW